MSDTPTVGSTDDPALSTEGTSPEQPESAASPETVGDATQAGTSTAEETTADEAAAATGTTTPPVVSASTEPVTMAADVPSTAGEIPSASLAVAGPLVVVDTTAPSVVAADRRAFPPASTAMTPADAGGRPDGTMAVTASPPPVGGPAPPPLVPPVPPAAPAGSPPPAPAPTPGPTGGGSGCSGTSVGGGTGHSGGHASGDLARLGDCSTASLNGTRMRLAAYGASVLERTAAPGARPD